MLDYLSFFHFSESEACSGNGDCSPGIPYPGISKSQIMNALTSYTPNSPQAEARFLTLPSIDFTTLTSILLIKAAFLLGNIDFSLFLFSLPITIYPRTISERLPV